MEISILTSRTESFYTAYSPELAIFSYGQCQEEALNNLQDELRVREQVERQNENGN